MENQRIIQVEDKVPFNLLVPLSIQHMFAMFGASILVPAMTRSPFSPFWLIAFSISEIFV